MNKLLLKLGCEVRTFDPSMTVSDHLHAPNVWFYRIGLLANDTTWSNGWKMMTFHSILKVHNHINSVIDILKIDIEYSEWGALETMFMDGTLTKVKQLLIETHSNQIGGKLSSSTVANYNYYLKTMRELYKRGFRMWKTSWNHFGNFTSKLSGAAITCCFEMYFINVNFVVD